MTLGVRLLCVLATCLSCSTTLAQWMPPTIEPRHLLDLPELLEPESIAWSDLAEAGSRATRQLLQQDRSDGSGDSRGPEGSQRLVARRCRLTRGDWCGRYERQEPEPTKPPPCGSKPCPNGCNNIGNCNHDTGVCDCPAGWTGDDCKKELKRPCTNRYRESGFVPTSHIDENGRDLNWLDHGWMAGRCPGICDDTLAACFCDNPDHGRIPAPKGSPPGTPPIRSGRQLSDPCFPRTTWNGQATSWGNTKYERLYGKTGWCNATWPEGHCGCNLDGHHGLNCDEMSEQVCPNQCTGRGTCHLGFCKCYTGWYGTDCSRRVAGHPYEFTDMASGTRPWLSAVVQEPPAAADPPREATRKRPFIYIYDLPAEFNTRMLQYRVNSDGCMHRRFKQNNDSYTVTHNLYATELMFHETLAQSEHRTFDPEEADFFYVPIYVTCFMHPVLGWVDHPVYFGPLPSRTLQAANFMMEAQKWIRKTHPWWDRRQGRDHLWLALHDEGACWMPSEIYNTSTILAHWGRMDFKHESNTAYEWDNYTKSHIHPEWQPNDWRTMYAGHPCYTPGKDLLIPMYKVPAQYSESPLIGAPWRKRTILMFFRGDVGTTRLSWYSRQIRQRLYIAAKEHNWVEKYNIRIGFAHDPQVNGSYSESLARSKFCLVAPGDGWSGRAEDSVLHGCIPVVIMDNVHAVYESILDWDSFAVRINEKSLMDLPHILMSIPDDKLARMQRRLARVWTRFAWATGPFLRGLNARWHDKVLAATAGRESEMDAKSGVRAIQKPWPVEEDAFHTIISWLYSRIPHTR